MLREFGTMILAMLFGSVIGMERQARQRMAGVRTNALVALGAASFVIFSGLFPGEASPTRVSAQIVSGVGFLGAGLIFRDRFSVHGLNTAATLWCSAAVGMMTGAGAFLYAGSDGGRDVHQSGAQAHREGWIDLRFLAGQPAPLPLPHDRDRPDRTRARLAARSGQGAVIGRIGHVRDDRAAIGRWHHDRGFGSRGRGRWHPGRAALDKACRFSVQSQKRKRFAGKCWTANDAIRPRLGKAFLPRVMAVLNFYRRRS